MSRRTPGMPIPGTERTITAAEQAAALGLQPGSAPKDAKPRGLTPNQARKLMSDQWPDEAPDDGRVEYTVPAGRDVLDLLGVDPADLPLGVEQELGPPQPRPERRPERESSPPPSRDEAAAEVAKQVNRVQERVAADVERAKARVRAAMADGTPLEERQAAAKDAHDTAAFAQKIGERIKEKVSQ